MDTTDWKNGLSLFHVGMVVPDLGEAMALWSTALGVRFAPPKEFALEVTVLGEPRAVELSATYSDRGPTHLELIEEHSGATWADEAFGLNHIGYYAQDMNAAIANLERAGMPLVLALPNVVGTDEPRAAYHRTDTGMWIELVHTGFADTLESWIAQLD